MRMRDDKKQEALIQATITVVNSIGLASSSVAKIAKEAGVSPATLYIYYKNKEDLLLSTYTEVKLSMGLAMVKGYDESMPIRDSLQLVWNNTFCYATENRDEFRFAEQFGNSPYSLMVDKKKIEETFQPVERIVQKGIEQKILKNVDLDCIAAFMFYPIFALANPYHCKTFSTTRENIDGAFNMAWDALRL